MKLSTAQQALLDRVEREGYAFVSGAQIKTARSLVKRGLAEHGCRNPHTGETTVAYSGAWCSTVERKG